MEVEGGLGLGLEPQAPVVELEMGFLEPEV